MLIHFGGGVQPNAATKCNDQVQILILEAQWVPPTNLQLHYKMQKIWLDLQETLNFRNNIETLQNAKPGAFFFNEKMLLV